MTKHQRHIPSSHGTSISHVYIAGESNIQQVYIYISVSYIYTDTTTTRRRRTTTTTQPVQRAMPDCRGNDSPAHCLLGLLALIIPEALQQLYSPPHSYSFPFGRVYIYRSPSSQSLSTSLSDGCNPFSLSLRYIPI